MTLNLDTRQRAMLLEMGVHMWWPDPAPDTLTTAPPLAEEDSNSVAPESMNTWARGQFEPQPRPTAPTQPPPAGPAVAHAPSSAHPPTHHAAPQTLSHPPVPQAVPALANASANGLPPQRPRTPPPTKVTGLPQGIEHMDWPTLQASVLACQACAMCLGRRGPVLAVPLAPMPCDWLVVGDPPDEPQESAGVPFVGEAGALLDKMLHAVGASRWPLHSDADAGGVPTSRAYLTHVLKCRPALVRAPNATELATCAHYLRREIALTQPKVILAMGRFAMQVLLSDVPPEQARLPLGKLRGQVWRFAGVPMVVTYPPDYLLRSAQDKGKAWADLQLARSVVQPPNGSV